MLEAAFQITRGAFALDAAFTAPEGAITALFGRSGAGKSLTLSAIAGLARIDAGRIALNQLMLDDAQIHMPPHQRGIGLVFQDAKLFPHLNVAANLDYAITRAPRSLMSRADAITRFDIGHLLDRRVGKLSGGEKSRVALARAVLSAPDLLLLDEPFAALDSARKRAFIATLVELNAQLKLPMIVVTHQIEDAAALAAHIVGMADGKVVANGVFRETVLTPAFQALLDRHDVGAALPAASLRAAEAHAGGAIWLRADNVLLAARRPEGVSARNVFEGHVEAVTTDGDAVLVRIEAAPGALLSRVTPEAAAELALSPGQAVWALAKAHGL